MTQHAHSFQLVELLPLHSTHGMSTGLNRMTTHTTRQYSTRHTARMMVSCQSVTIQCYALHDRATAHSPAFLKATCQRTYCEMQFKCRTFKQSGEAKPQPCDAALPARPTSRPLHCNPPEPTGKYCTIFSKHTASTHVRVCTHLRTRIPRCMTIFIS